jgi:hypothetical protein
MNVPYKKNLHLDGLKKMLNYPARQKEIQYTAVVFKVQNLCQGWPLLLLASGANRATVCGCSGRNLTHPALLALNKF